MKIIVNTKNYTPFNYDIYFGGGTPENNPYVVGQVVVVKHDNKIACAVVLGVITPDEVRLELCGMTSIEDIRPATISDFADPNIDIPDVLRAECSGKKVSYDWENYKLTIE
jgi:hypothetical protein